MSHSTETPAPLPPPDATAGPGDGREGRGPAFTASEEVEQHFVHPSAKRFFVRHPWTRRIPIFGPACEGYGTRCLASLGATHFLCKGVAEELLHGLVYAILVNRYGVEGKRYQRLASLYTLGWSTKPFTAIVCDGFAFFGYTKRWYMAISCLMGAACALALALLPAKGSSADTGSALIFFTSFCKANVDILTQGFYSRLMIKYPEQGPSLVSWVWWFTIIGSIVSSILVGPLTDAKVPQVGIYISMALQLLTSIIFIFNGYGEKTNRENCAEDASYKYMENLKDKESLGLIAMKDGDSKTSSGDNEAVLQNYLVESVKEETKEFLRVEPVDCCCGVFEFNKVVFVNNWRAFVYGVVMTCSVITMVICNLFADRISLLIACVVVSAVCCGASFWALPLAIAKVNVFVYLQTLTFLRLPGALNTFYMANDKCVPGGPNFSYTFYNTVAAIVSNIGGLIGVLCFSQFFLKFSYRLALILPTLAIMCSSIVDIMIVNRWNIKIGLPDHFVYLFGHGVIVQILMKLQSMPITVLLSRLCPRGTESLVYALLAGSSSLGRSGSTTLGAVVMEFIWPVKSKVPCDFHNMGWLVFFCHGITPAITIPFLFLLIPSARICDKLGVDGHAVAKEAAVPMERPAKGEEKRPAEASR